MKKVIAFAFITMLILCGFSECGYTQEVIPEDTYEYILTGTNASFSHYVEGIEVITSYDTNGYELSDWLLTDSKMISFSVRLAESTTSEVLMEHAHLDIRLKSYHPQLNGLSQDSMDDSYHGTSQDGFLITDKYSYNEIFSIDGYSDKLIEGWGFVCGSYGSTTISEKRLDESSLRKAGTYGSELVVVYNLLIKHEGEDYYHTVLISDKIRIPVNPNWSPTTITMNYGDTLDDIAFSSNMGDD